MEKRELMIGTKKNITIIKGQDNFAIEWSLSIGEEFQEDIFKKDFERLMEEKFPQYTFNLIIDYENIVNLSTITATEILGDVSEEEKERILDCTFEDPLLLLHAEGDYFVYNPDLFPEVEDTNAVKEYPSDDDFYIINGIYDLSNFKDRELTSVELFFLKYITMIKSNPLKNISLDWSFDYHLDFSDVVNQFVGQNLVEVEELNLSDKIDHKSTLAELRELLRPKGVTMGGRKSEVIQKVIDNSDDRELQVYRDERYVRYNLTEKGRNIIKDINPSITRDMEAEDRRYHLVLNRLIDEAYGRRQKKSTVFKWHSRKPIEKEVKDRSFVSKAPSKFHKMRDAKLNLPKEIADKEEEIISCIVVANMYGCNDYYTVSKLIKRLVEIDIEDHIIEEYIETVMNY